MDLGITCLAFRPCLRGHQEGFAKLRLAAWGDVIIEDVSIHRSGKTRWALPPSMPLVESGELVRTADGKIRYRYIFNIGPIKEAFYAQSVAAVDAFRGAEQR